MTAVGATAVGLTSVRANLEFEMIINIGSTIILWMILVLTVEEGGGGRGMYIRLFRTSIRGVVESRYGPGNNYQLTHFHLIRYCLLGSFFLILLNDNNLTLLLTFGAPNVFDMPLLSNQNTSRRDSDNFVTAVSSFGSLVVCWSLCLSVCLSVKKLPLLEYKSNI